MHTKVFSEQHVHKRTLCANEYLTHILSSVYLHFNGLSFFFKDREYLKSFAVHILFLVLVCANLVEILFSILEAILKPEDQWSCKPSPDILA